MSERGSSFDLEEALRDVGARLAYPASADLRPAVLARIEGGERRGLLDLFRSPLSLAPAVATLALLLAATLAFQPVAGQAAEALGLRGITLFRVAQVTEREAARILPAEATRVGSVESASGILGFDVRAPELGAPDAVYVLRQGAGVAFLIYGERSGIPAAPTTGVSALIVQAQGGVETQLISKGIPPGTTVEELEVNGGRGVWIEGEPHEVYYRAPNGDILTDTVRLAGNVLLWEQDGLLMRIEAQISRQEALRIAASMR